MLDIAMGREGLVLPQAWSVGDPTIHDLLTLFALGRTGRFARALDLLLFNDLKRMFQL